ncbi:hypothetical protein KDL01_27790 [Actinospica durhamensis]|uniref:Uncharacterized protein n=1 Tax=Actinospica durhamensis TaxID=1508375 RepID=A0A941EU79_9ACTN|nr:SAV_915 family protein [Actinospica durhamensis]MBR7837111.1 hypothetical protein [Actinospica durhamensis]
MLEEPPDTERLYVPLHGAACGVALRYFHDEAGSRCAIGFTDLGRMAELLGSEQAYYRLTARAVRELAGAAGVTVLIVDPARITEHPEPAAPAVATGGTVHRHAAPVHAAAHGLSAVRSALEHSQAAGILVVSAGAGAAALVLEALR